MNQYKSIEEAFQEGDTTLGVLRTLQMMIMASSLYESCFTGDTLVATEDGENPIEDIEVGDLVWAYDVENGGLELKEVKTIYEKETKKLLHLQTSTGIISTTSNHPFYVLGKGWVAAGDLERKDEIYALDGTTSVVLGWEYEELLNPVTVYNLEIEDYNTYFVGDYGVLVHNYGDEGGSQALKGASKTPVIGRMDDMKNVGSNEYRVADLLPDQGSPKANWNQNSSVLRSTMNQGNPIRDASPFNSSLDPKLGITGTQNANTFLHMERNLLYDHGWRYSNGFWSLP